MDIEFLNFVRVVVEKLNQAEIPYAIGGAFASSIYGEFRLTIDVDVSVQITSSQIETITGYFENLGWYLTAEAAHKALEQGGEFQLIDPNAFKFDFYVMPPVLNARQERVFERRQRSTYGLGVDKTAWVMSPEDVILYKLDWYQQGKSGKHLRDIGIMLDVKKVEIDRDYIDQWAGEINAIEEWEKLKVDHH